MSAVRTIDDVCEQIVDCEHKTAPIDPDGEYFAVGTPAMRGNRINYEESRRISKETFVKWTRRLVPMPGDLLFAREAPVGPIVRIPDSGNVAPGQRTMLLRPDPQQIDSHFFYYLLTSPQQQDLLLSKASGSTVAHLNVADVRAFQLPKLPELAQQRAIAEVLGALDDKIAVNTKLASASTKLADILYRQVLASTAIQWSPIGSIATTVLGGTPDRAIVKYWIDGTVPWLNSGKANEERITKPSEYITEEALSRSAAKLMPVGATLVAITGATLGQVARLGIEASGNQSLIGIWANNAFLNDWLYFAVRDQIPELLKKSTGAAQQHVNKRDVDALEVPVTSNDILISFASQARPLLDAAVSADRESDSLAATRDALLPQLMSGKLRVKDAEAIVEDVA